MRFLEASQAWEVASMLLLLCLWYDKKATLVHAQLRSIHFGMQDGYEEGEEGEEEGDEEEEEVKAFPSPGLPPTHCCLCVSYRKQWL